MRRDGRRRAKEIEWWKNKKIVLGTSIFSITLAFIIGIAVYSNDINEEKSEPDNIISIVPENDIEDKTESASTSIGNTIEESKAKDTKIENNQQNVVINKTEAEKNNKLKNDNANNTTKKKTIKTNATPTEKKEIDFYWPIKGDILKAFSVDNLLFSSTLQEWTVHNGIDIKATKASVVSASADGIIKSIKNDPRYGLTVVIEHQDGYKTIYSNLLTAEFVVEGENVKKEQSIGTVGNSASFEIADETHLHFEMLKDSEYVDPMLYLK